MSTDAVQCVKCSGNLLYGNVGNMWLYACGHIVCGVCAELNCCNDQASVMDLMQDEAVAHTYWYAQGLYPMISTYPPIAQLLDSLHFFIRSIANTYLQNHLQSLPALPQPCLETMFLNLDTLSLSPSLIDKPWQCPRDGKVVKGGETRCDCGYVNLKAVMLDPAQASIWQPGNAQKSRGRRDPNLWTCASCTYEYNQVSSHICGYCGSQRSPTYRCPSCSKETSDPGPCETCNQSRGWTCVNCHRCNPVSSTQCPCTLWACGICNYASNPDSWNICKKCQSWKCRNCTCSNYPASQACQTCEQPRNI